MDVCFTRVSCFSSHLCDHSSPTQPDPIRWLKQFRSCWWIRAASPLLAWPPWRMVPCSTGAKAWGAGGFYLEISAHQATMR